MKEKLTKNLSLKIFAVLFAISLWLISININDPYQSRSYTVNVQLLNMSAMTNAGKYVEVLGDTDSVVVSVRASRSMLDGFSASDIIATADLNELTADNQVPIKLNTGKSGSSSSIEAMRPDHGFVSVQIEDIIRVQKKITVEIKNKPAKGYLLGRTSTEQNALTISGPKSLVENVDKAVVTFNVDGASEDVSMLLPIELYNQDDERISDNRLSMNITQVQGSATILTTKAVPVIVLAEGIPENGFMASSEVTVEPSTILVAAKPAVLKNVSEITVAGEMNLQGAVSDLVATIDIKNYLPDGVILGGPAESSLITASIAVEKEITMEVPLTEDSITLSNIPEGYEATMNGLLEDAVVQLIGLQSVVQNMSETEVSAFVDVDALLEKENMIEEESYDGTYLAEISFNLPEGVRVRNPLKIYVVLKGV